MAQTLRHMSVWKRTWCWDFGIEAVRRHYYLNQERLFQYPFPSCAACVMSPFQFNLNVLLHVSFFFNNVIPFLTHLHFCQCPVDSLLYLPPPSPFDILDLKTLYSIHTPYTHPLYLFVSSSASRDWSKSNIALSKIFSFIRIQLNCVVHIHALWYTSSVWQCSRW